MQLLMACIFSDFDEPKLEILNMARKLFEDISEMSDFDINEKRAIIYLFDVLSSNMLDDREYGQYVEENIMLLNPVERYLKNEGIKEGMEKGKLDVARNMLDEGFSIENVVRITGLSKEDILNSK